MKKGFPYHVLFFAIYPLLLVWSTNVSIIDGSQTARAFVLILAAVILLLMVLRLLIGDWRKSGLIATLIVVPLLYYGYLIDIFKGYWTGSSYDLHRYAVSVIAIVWIVGIWLVWRILKPTALHISHNLFTAIALTFLIIPIYQIVTHFVTISDAPLFSDVQVDDGQLSSDIYYIVLDEYVRDDVLTELYGYDNSPFLDSLRDQGFTIATNSRSNYAITTLSIASAMNFDYIESLTASVEQVDYAVLKRLVQNSQLRQIMEQEGYQIISLSSGYGITDLRDADIYLSYNANMLNKFEIMILQNSLPGVVFSTNLSYEIQRQRILYTFEQLAQIPVIPGKKFVMAHVVAPHPPFVFDAVGNAVNPSEHYTSSDAFNTGISQEAYIKGYREQVQYINYLVLETVREILAKSETPPIIIIQGDHGGRAYTDWESVEDTCLKERMSILNAYYFPEPVDDLYDAITPVNTFRIVLNNFFNADLEILPDKNYFSMHYSVDKYVDITNEIESYCDIQMDDLSEPDHLLEP